MLQHGQKLFQSIVREAFTSRGTIKRDIKIKVAISIGDRADYHYLGGRVDHVMLVKGAVTWDTLETRGDAWVQNVQCRRQGFLDSSRVFVEDTEGEGLASQGCIIRVYISVRVCQSRENPINGRV